MGVCLSVFWKGKSGLMDHCHGAVKPAHETKHIPLLEIRGSADAVFYLTQSDDGADNGTTLWLAGQVLAMTLPALLPSKGTGIKRRAIELGSGTGYTALVLAALGWDVVATDTQSVIRSVLQKNIETNKLSVAGNVEVRELDWTVTAAPAPVTDSQRECPGFFDLILTADTLYVPHLVEPLLRTIHSLARDSPSALILIAIERRDSALLDSALQRAQSEFGFHVQRVPNNKLAKAIKKTRCEWRKEDWSGVELWKLVFQV